MSWWISYSPNKDNFHMGDSTSSSSSQNLNVLNLFFFSKYLWLTIKPLKKSPYSKGADTSLNSKFLDFFFNFQFFFHSEKITIYFMYLIFPFSFFYRTYSEFGHPEAVLKHSNASLPLLMSIQWVNRKLTVF